MNIFLVYEEGSNINIEKFFISYEDAFNYLKTERLNYIDKDKSNEEIAKIIDSMIYEYQMEIFNKVM